MAENILPEHQSKDRGIEFAAAGKLYQIHPDATSADARDQLSARLSQLHSMLIITHGCGLESFENWSDDIKDNYLWGCAMLAKECKELVRHI